MDLRANTAVDVLIGPFVDSGDGNTTEDGLTLSQADIKLSKNGQALAQKNDTTAAAFDDDGYYNCELDATDTNTEGNLVLIVHESGALPVRHEYDVISEAAWDSLYVAKDTGFMDVNVKAISEDTAAADNLESACDNYSVTRGLTGTALPAAAADAGGGVPISDDGGLDMDSILEKMLAYIRLLVRSDAAVETDAATELTAINADEGAGGGDYSSQTDSVEAIKDYVAPASEYDTQLDANMSTRAPSSEYDTQLDANMSTRAPSSEYDTQLDGNISTILAKLLAYFRLALRSDAGPTTDDSTELTAINADGGSGGGDYAATDAQEGIRDRGDAAWVTATGFAPASEYDTEMARITANVATESKQDTAQTELNKIGTIPALDSAGQTIGAAIAKLADDNGGADFDATNDSLERIQSRLPAALVSGRMDVSVGAMAATVLTAAAIATDAITAAKIAADAIGSSELATTAVNEIRDAIFQGTLTEGYSADGAAVTLEEGIYEIMQSLTEFAISGTTITVKKRDGLTTALTVTLDNASDPTSRTRAT